MSPNPPEGSSNKNEGGAKCPFINNIDYPPVAPIPGVRKTSKKMSRQSSVMNGPSASGSSGLFAPPNLPSRCTWQLGVKQKGPHTLDERYGGCNLDIPIYTESFIFFTFCFYSYKMVLEN